MSLASAAYLKSLHETTQAVGKKAINSDFSFEIDGFESAYLLTKQAPWPVLSSAGEIEVPNLLGSMEYQPQQLKTYKQGPISLFETVAGTIDKLLVDLITSGTVFNATVYEGTPSLYLRNKRLKNCFIVLDDPDRDWENRTQVLTFSGTLFYHYFGEIGPGNALEI